ncbi:MAG: MFS transporter [Proteobacteria bacterium]|nr:MFS transporter [Pseudomonadota bacterium]
MPGTDAERNASADREEIGGPYAHYVLGVLALVYVFNFLDRQILSILNERIKADLGLGDAQMAFLYGTAFAVFYAVFGIPLGRLADVWNRRSLISIGLGFWSVMTALSGLARSFGQLAAARIGVGVGEASATPAAFSLLSDYYAPARRATVLAIYSSGIYIGAGLGLMIGGQIVERWETAFAGTTAPFGLAGWQVAFFAVGLPGLLMALWVRTLREPRRGQAEGIDSPDEPHPHPFAEFGRELRSVIPPFTVFHLRSLGAGRRGLALNGAAALVIAAVAALLTAWTGDAAQWIALAIGVYAAFSWSQSLALKDRPTSALLFGTPSLRWLCIGLGFLAFTGYGVGYWTAPFFVRMHGVSEGDVGFFVGGAAAAGGWLGVTLGGILADILRRRAVPGRLWVGMAAAVLPLPFGFWMLGTSSTTTAFIVNFPVSVLTSMWIGVGASTVTDLVLPRMRASASAFYLMMLTFIGLALGPYTIGLLSDALGDLRMAMRIGFSANVAALLCLLVAARHLARDEETLRDRARAAGETSI